MAGLVEGEDPLLLVRDDPSLLEAGEHTLHRRIEVRHVHVLAAAPGGEDRRLVGDVRELGARQPGRAARDDA